LGRAILEGAQRVRISGRDAVVRAEIRRIDSYSAHADRVELIKWIDERDPLHGSLFLIHGEPAATRSLRAALADHIPSIVEPEIGERYELVAGGPARRMTTGRAEIREALGRDWQNEYADFAANLKRELQRIRSAEEREKALERMRAVLEQYSGKARPRA
jgi:metallo-beta-lactamase family protein